jgi:hypothetical protein
MPLQQHSYGLLLWSGFVVPTVLQNRQRVGTLWPQRSKHHLDGLAVGGCLRYQPKSNATTLVGVRLIDYCASKCKIPPASNAAALLMMEVQQQSSSSRQYRRKQELLICIRRV